MTALKKQVFPRLLSPEPILSYYLCLCSSMRMNVEIL